MKKLIRFPSRQQVIRSMLAAGIVLVATLMMVIIGRNTLGEGVIALLYLVPIGWCTVRWGKLAGLGAAVAAALSFNFCFIPPLYTFSIGSTEGWLLFFLFVAGSIIIVGRIQTLIITERNREREATFMYELVAATANLQTRESIARAIASQLQQQYQAAFVRVNVMGRGGLPTIVACSPTIKDCTPPGNPSRALPIFSGPEMIGEIVIWKGMLSLPSEEDYLMQSFVRQTAMTLQRAQTAEEGNSRTLKSGFQTS